MFFFLFFCCFVVVLLLFFVVVGEAQYQMRLNDLRVLKLKVKDVMRELMISKKQGSQTDDLKREVFRLQKDLLQEKTKVKALSEELENPMNVHR